MNKNPCLLTAEEAFKKGADLWIVSDPWQNVWNQKIDWYLSFWMKKNRMTQITPLPEYKASRTVIIDKDIAKLIGSPPKSLSFLEKDYGVTLPLNDGPTSQTHQPLLMESSRRLPCLWTVELTFINKETWLKQAWTLWDNLNRPSLRIFAPRFVQVEDVEKTWPKETISIQYIGSGSAEKIF